jgi:hypothetical protein
LHSFGMRAFHITIHHLWFDRTNNFNLNSETTVRDVTASVIVLLTFLVSSRLSCFVSLPFHTLYTSSFFHLFSFPARSSVVGWGIELQVWKSRVQFLLKSMDISIYLTLPAAQCRRGRLSL